MRAIDNLLKEARLIRIARAKRVQDEAAAAAARAAAAAAEALAATAEGRAPRRLAGPVETPPPPVNWMDECAAAQMVLSALADPTVPVGDARRKRAIGVLDMAAVQPFVVRAVAMLDALCEEMRPQDAVFEAMWPKICAHVAPASAAVPEDFDAGRARRGAARDVAQLVVESVLFEVVRGTIRAADARRPVAHRPDLAPVILEDGRARRAPVAHPLAASRAKARRDALGIPVSDLAAVPQAERGAGKAKSRTLLEKEMRAARRVARDEAARAKAARKAVRDARDGAARDGSVQTEVVGFSQVFESSEDVGPLGGGPLEGGPLECLAILEDVGA